jgi:hypothetical protein
VGIIVEEPKAVGPLNKAQVEVVVHETEFHPLDPLYFIPWRHECLVAQEWAFGMLEHPEKQIETSQLGFKANWNH